MLILDIACIIFQRFNLKANHNPKNTNQYKYLKNITSRQKSKNSHHEVIEYFATNKK
jgi:hypothetical protein